MQTETSDIIEIGTRVLVRNSAGTVRFVGATDFADGDWYGIELDVGVGNHDGKVQGVQYFQCKNKYGVFSRIAQLRSMNEKENFHTEERKEKNKSIERRYDTLSSTDDVFNSSCVLDVVDKDRIARHKLYVWGANTNSQLALGHNCNIVVPEVSDIGAFEPDVRLLNIVSGYHYCIALVSKHTDVDNHNDDYNGAAHLLIGRGNISDTVLLQEEEEAHHWSTNYRFYAIAAGNKLYAAVTHTQNVCVWSYNTSPHFAAVPSSSSSSSHTHASHDVCVRAIDVSADELCVCIRDGSLWRLNIENVKNMKFVHVDKLDVFIVDVCYMSTLCIIALDNEGRVWIVRGVIGEECVLMLEGIDGFVTQIACGDRHGIALTECGDVYSWCANKHTQLNNVHYDIDGEYRVERYVVKRLETLERMEARVIQIACGSKHSLCLFDTGRVCSWGNGDNGQLGHGNFSTFASPRPVIALEGKRISHIVAGQNQSMAFTGALQSPNFIIRKNREDGVKLFGEFDFGSLISPIRHSRNVSSSSSSPSSSSSSSSSSSFTHKAEGDETFGALSKTMLDFDGAQIDTQSEYIVFEWRQQTIECAVLLSSSVVLTHRSITFTVDASVQYRGALNSYIQAMYDHKDPDVYILKHTATSRVMKHSEEPTTNRVCSLLLICRHDTSTDVSLSNNVVPLWIRAFIDSFHPLNVGPHFVQLSPKKI